MFNVCDIVDIGKSQDKGGYTFHMCKYWRALALLVNERGRLFVADKKNNDIADRAKIAVIDERTIRNKIYVVRGIQVMLDFELAEIYGYTTSAFNQQVKRNGEKIAT